MTKNEIEAKIKLYTSPEQEVVPPDISGKRGLTVRELEAMKLDERKDNGREFLVLPPQSENKRGGGNERGDIRVDRKASKDSKGTTGNGK